MTKVGTIIVKFFRMKYMKYVVVCILGVVIVGFLDNNSVWAHLRNKQRISQLEEEIEKYTSQYERDQAKIREMNTDPIAIERIARERYFMKCDDEDIFVLSEDE